MLKNKIALNFWFLILSLSGLMVSIYLFIPYAQDTSVALCSTGGGCDAVKDSGFSHFFGIKHWIMSLPFWGVVFYGFLTFYNIVRLAKPVWLSSVEQKIKLKLDLIGIVAGFLFSIYLTGLEQFVITAWCSFCIIQSIIASLFFVSYLYAHLIMSIKDKIRFLLEVISYIGVVYLVWLISSKTLGVQPSLWITLILLGILFVFVLMHFPMITAFIYSFLLKPIFFRFDPESVHDLMVSLGQKFGKISIIKYLINRIYGYKPKNLYQNLAEIDFVSPVGLSAGFDYNGRLTNILGQIGFGFESAGTVTYSFYEGNQKPRLGRLIKSQSLLVNKGFKSMGIDYVLTQNLHTLPQDFAVGLSLGATNSPETSTTDTQIMDILKSFEKVKDRKDFAYFELNISCPNVAGSGHLANPQALEEILSKISKLNLKRPLFVKFPAEIDWQEARRLVQIMIKYQVAGVICSNLVKNRQNNDFDANEISLAGKGHFSGKPVEKLSNELIKNIYQEFKGQILIVGLGGVFTAEDAYKKIKLGANLVQLITGMIYGGPSTIWEINQGLSKLISQDGYKNISQAVGADNKLVD